jgi:2-polyprenyl-6-methoxyphenol hydroxylase-like FAD-dependent oxidoreductase
MHKRVVERLSDGRRFLMGDAAHLSSPLGGEGLNAALMDAGDLAWKLAPVLRGAAKPSLLDSYATERGLADHHVLEVSDDVHGDATGREVPRRRLPEPAARGSGEADSGRAQTVDARRFVRREQAGRSGRRSA